MSTPANVLSIQAIDCFRAVLMNFSSDLKEVLSTADHESRRLTEDMFDAVIEAERVAEQRRSEVAALQAQQSFARTQDADWTCPGLGAALYHLSEAEQRLKELKEALRSLSSAVERHQSWRLKWETSFGEVIQKAGAELSRTLNRLDAYTSADPPTLRKVPAPAASLTSQMNCPEVPSTESPPANKEEHHDAGICNGEA